MKKIFLSILFLISFIIIKAETPGSIVGAGEDFTDMDLGAVVVQDEDNGVQTGINEFSQATTVFKNSDIAGTSAMTVADILGEVPGIYFNKSEIVSFGTGMFCPSVLKIRGLGETPNAGILTVIDGRPQSMGIYRHPLFDTLALDSIESIEVIKGPNGVLFGNQAVAGVINITTKKRELEGGSYTLGTMIGSHFTQDHFINAVIKKEEIDINVSGGYSSTEGARPNSDNYLENVHAHAGYEIDKNLTASVNIDYAFVRAFNPGPIGSNWPREVEASKTIQRDGDFRVEYKANDYTGSTIFFSDSGSNKISLDVMPPLFTTIVPGSYSEYQNNGIRIMNEWIILPGNSTKVGFDWQYFGGFFSSTMKDAGWHENDYAPYVSISQKVGIFGASAGLRYEFNSAWGSIPIPQAGFNISLFDQQSFYVNVSKGFKTPAMGVWAVSTYDELNPEEFWQYEVGATQTIFENIKYDISLYQTEGNNIMQTDVVDGKLKNTGTILFRGVEADVSGKLFDIYKLGLSGSYIDPRNKTAHIAYLSGSAYIEAAIMKKTAIKLSADFAKDRFDANNKINKLSDYMTLSLLVDYRAELFGTDTSFYLNIDNMFDNKYEVKKGYPNSGFLIKGGLVIRL
ncbi:MAG: TonB-dependent receptor [bacterium]